MPTLKPEDMYTDLGDAPGTAPSVRDTIYNAPEPTISQTLFDSALLHNTIVSTVLNPDYHQYEYQEGFDGTKDMPNDHVSYIGDYAATRTPEEAARLRFSIDEQLAARQRLSDSGMTGFVTGLVAGTLDPLILVPGGAYIQAVRTAKNAKTIYSVGKSYAAGAGAVGSIVAGQEAVLHAAQPTRTVEESAYAVGFAAMLGGLFTGGGAAYANRLLRKSGMTVNEVIDKAVHLQRIDAEAKAEREGTAAPKTEGEVAPEVGADAGTGSVGAARAGYDPGGVNVPNRYVDLALRLFGRQDAVLRTINSPLEATRRAGADIAEVGFDLQMNTQDVASGVPMQRAVQDWHNQKLRAEQQIMDVYKKYLLQGRKPVFGEVGARVLLRDLTGGRVDADRLSVDDFFTEIGHAMIDGDTHHIPEVAEAAKIYREQVYNPLVQEAQHLGLLKDIPDVKTAASYLNRVYDKAALRHPSNQQAFIEQAVQYIKERNVEAAKRIEEFEKELPKLREQLKNAEQEVQAKFEAFVDEAKEAYKQLIDEISMTDLFNEFGIESEPKFKTADQKHAAALKSARKEYYRVLKEELSRILKDEYGAALKEEFDAIQDEALRGVEERERLRQDVRNEHLDDPSKPAPPEKPTLRDDLVDTTAGSAADATGKIADDAVANGAYESAIQEAMAKAEAAYRKKLKSIENYESKLADDVEFAAHEDVKEAVFRARQKAATRARKDARDRLKSEYEAIRKQKKELEDKLRENERDKFDVERSDDEILDIAETLLARINGLPLDYTGSSVDMPRIGNRHASAYPSANALGERKFLIEDKKIEFALVKDVRRLASVYTKSMSSAVEFNRRFPGGMDVIKESVYKEAAAERDRILEEAKKKVIDGNLEPKEAQKIMEDADKRAEAIMERHKQDLVDIEVMVDRLSGRYGLPESTAEVSRDRFVKFLMNWTYVAKLGFMTLSAIPDLIRPAMVHGFDRAFGDFWKPFLSADGEFRKVFNEMLQQQRDDFAMAADYANSVLMQSLIDNHARFQNETALERGMSWLADRAGHVYLMSQWNAAMKQIAGTVTMQRLIRAMREDIAGTISDVERTYLRANYISDDMSRRIMEQIDEHGYYHAERDFTIPSIRQWEAVDHEAALAFRSAMARDVERTIVTPGLDRPTFTYGGKHTPFGFMGRFAGQFHSFAFASTHRTIIAGLQQGDAAYVGGFAMSVALGTLSYMAKQMAAGREIETDWPELLSKGVDQSGMLGWLMDANNIMEKVSRNTIGIHPWLGLGESARYASRDPLGSVIGASYGTVRDSAEIVGTLLGAPFSDDISVTGRTMEKLQRTLPLYMSAFYIKRPLDVIRESLQDQVGIPDSNR